ncbi:hypothetical protein [Streptomyces sp. HUAS ZL42]|uniref:hypothetical protein n=1 Tax=Streptomyces sp. HUAS ZL42 TaxID=3231715 RepID=UPI00345EBD56
MTTPLLLLLALVAGTYLVFKSSLIVGLVLMGAGFIGLMIFMSTVGSRQRPGENEMVIEERHYIGRNDEDHHRYHH